MRVRHEADFNDPGFLTPPETSLLVDQYELAMAASYHRQGMNEPAAFELFARRLPPNRDWLLAAGLGPALRLVTELRFGARELEYLASIGFPREFLDYLGDFRFSGDIDAVPEGSLVFTNEPLVRVTASRIEGQLLETLLLNQVNFQTMLATKAARIVLAAGGGDPGRGGEVVDFSPRRDHGADAAMKAARSAAIAGAAGTSNVAAAMRYGLPPVGTMAHSYVMSFASEEDAFRTFMRDTPENAVMLVDTYETLEGVRRAISASRATGVRLRGVRLDSGDIPSLARETRRLLDEAGMGETTIVASGDLDEGQIARCVAAGAPVDVWGVGTDLGTSRDSPTVNGVYKLVADRGVDGRWRGVVKRSAAKATMPGRKQVFRRYEADGTMSADTIALAGEDCRGERLLVPAMRGGEIVGPESLAEVRGRAARELRSLPRELRVPGEGERRAYPVEWSEHLREAAAEATALAGVEAPAGAAGGPGSRSTSD